MSQEISIGAEAAPDFYKPFRSMTQIFRNHLRASQEVVSFTGFNCLSDSDEQIDSFESIVNRHFRRFQELIILRLKRRSDLLSLREIAKLSDETLADVGLRRGDLYWASKLPLQMSPSDELDLIRSGHSS